MSAARVHAQRVYPTLQDHLKMAKDTQKKVK